MSNSIVTSFLDYSGFSNIEELVAQPSLYSKTQGPKIDFWDQCKKGEEIYDLMDVCIHDVDKANISWGSGFSKKEFRYDGSWKEVRLPSYENGIYRLSDKSWRLNGKEYLIIQDLKFIRSCFPNKIPKYALLVGAGHQPTHATEVLYVGKEIYSDDPQCGLIWEFIVVNWDDGTWKTLSASEILKYLRRGIAEEQGPPGEQGEDLKAWMRQIREEKILRSRSEEK